MPSLFRVSIDSGEVVTVQPIVQYPIIEGTHMIIGRLLSADNEPTGEWISMTYGDMRSGKGAYVRGFQDSVMKKAIQDLFMRTP